MVWQIKRTCAVSIPLVAVLLGAIPSVRAEHQWRFGRTTEGGLAMTGNTLGLSKAPNLNCPGVGGSIGTFITDDAYSIDDYPESACSEDWPLGTTQYWAENSSSGQLDLPPEGTVLYAELIWGGSYFYGDEDVSDYIGLTDTIDLYYEEGSVISVAPDPATAFTTPEEMWSPSGFYIHYYVRSAEVTDFVRTNGSGVYSVGAVPATQDYHINSLNTAGWILVVAYQSVQMATRNLSIFVGGDWVDERASVDYSVSGFCTPPTGPVDGLVLIGAMEGDAELVGDTASVGAVGFPFVQLESPNNPIDNFFASQINDIYGYLDTRGTFGLRNHDPDPVTGSNYVGGRQGWDITGVFLSSDEGHLHNDQTSATLRVTSANAAADSYLTMMVSFEIDINAPFFDVAGASSVTPDEADVGQLLSYEFILDNTGSADAEEVVFYHPLPEGLALVELVLDSVPMTGVSTGDLATGVGIGTVPNYDFVILELQAEVESLPPAPDPAQFLTQARWEYVYHSCGTDPVIESQSLAGPLLVLLPRIEASLQAAPSAEVAPGDFVTLALTVENTGEASTSDAKLVVDIPDGLTYLAGSTTLNGSAIGDVAGDMPFADPASIHSPGESAGDVAPAESAVVTFQVEVDAGSAPSEPLIIAQVDSDGSGPAPAVSAELALNVVEPPESCGNGLIESGEACDDGNAVGGDGCSRTCQEEPGYDCQGEPSVCEHTCGNGDLDPGEECDDGDTLGGDGCDESCQEEPGYDCQGEPSVCEYACGNGELDPGEECDDGDTLGGDGCDESCQEEPGYDCQGEPSVCEPTCGNGVLDPTEGCDDGNNTAGDGCSHICQVESGYVCEGEPSDCTRTCGNGRLDGTEECDDGNTQDGDGCDSICQVEPGYDCVGQPSDCTTTCGNGRLDSGEDCDDGNTTPGDGCSSNCEVEYGYSCQGQPSVCSMSCGNGIINEGEGCDDGNLMPGDGCSSVCQVESGYVCEGEPSVCSQDSDNDGLSDDDENQIGTDPYHPDTDGDGLSDGTEVHGENPTDPLDSDSDDDQLCDGPVDLPPDCHNGEDTNADGRRDENETDPNDGDTDDGSVPDGEEVNRGTDPLDPSDDVVGGALSGPEACSCSSSSRRDVEKGLSLLWLVLALAASRRRRRFDGSPGPS